MQTRKTLFSVMFALLAGVTADAGNTVDDVQAEIAAVQIQLQQATQETLVLTAELEVLEIHLPAPAPAPAAQPGAGSSPAPLDSSVGGTQDMAGTAGDVLNQMSQAYAGMEANLELAYNRLIQATKTKMAELQAKIAALEQVRARLQARLSYLLYLQRAAAQATKSKRPPIGMSR